MIEPRYCSVPDGDGELGEQAVALAVEAGLELDPWQQEVLRGSLRRRPDGKWAAPDVGLNVARQNGKGAIVVARILAELYLVKSDLTIYSAHNFDTALEHFRRVVTLIENSSLKDEVLGTKGMRPYGITWGKGNEGVELRDGQRLQIRTRTASGGRGFSCDLLILDEAMILPEFMHSALEPILSARENPQIWYSGSAVDQEIHDHGVVFTRIRDNGIAGDPYTAYFEWSVEGDDPDAVLPDVLNDRAAWAAANPALGIRISPEFVSRELAKIGRRGFAVERLGIGDWPRTDYVAHNPVDFDAWSALGDDLVMTSPQFVAFDVSPERKAAIVMAGTTKDGYTQGELVESKKGTAWLAPEVARLCKTHKVVAVCDARGPAASLVPELRELDIAVEQLSSTEHAQACGHLLDGIQRGTIRHMNDPELNAAILSATTRPLGDAWAWNRKDSNTNIAPLVAFTLGVSAAMTREKPRRVTMAWA